MIEDVTIEDLLGPEYVPVDGDREFEDIASVFCRLSREQAIYGDTREIRESPYYMRLSSFLDVLPGYATRHKLVDTYRGPNILRYAVWAIMSLTTTGKDLSITILDKIAFEIPQLKIRGKLMGEASVFRFDTASNFVSVPLAMLSLIKKPGRIGLARYEVPHAIFQAVMAYSEDASLDQYDGFVICLDDMDMYLSRVKVSSAYLRSLYQRQAVTEDLPFYRSKKFNIFEPDGRRGLLKLLMGLNRYLQQSPQSRIKRNHIGYS